MTLPRWVSAALDYIPRWLEFQVRYHEQPGCAVAVAHKGKIVLEAAFGYADLAKRVRLTPRHRFRVASHSKSFAAAAVMKLREQNRLRLDDPVGRYVDGLHAALAPVTLAQLLSHSGGVVRDGPDSGQFVGRRAFLSAAELKADLQAAPPLKRNTRFKYSNHGYALLGLVVERVTGERYRSWLQREIIDATGLEETLADGPPARGVPLALGHSARLPVGRRVAIPGDYSTHAIAPAAGVISTARDLVRFFHQLSPEAARSVLSRASRREMNRRRWRDPHSSIERYYGLGLMSGSLEGWSWFGHSGGLQGYITRTCVLPGQALALSVLTNAVDGPAHLWLEGAVQLLRAFAQNGAPSRRLAGWSGRWWTLWNPIDLVATGKKVLVARPDFFNPLLDASEIAVHGRSEGRIALAGGYASHGEPARLLRNRRNQVLEVQLGGTRLRAERRVAREMASRYTYEPDTTREEKR
ncbi:MAG TPA: serine hydrolase domain-containing protein [Burkholderiales bacterium]|nr:serine hydrolase domain-containing protein [Burkholderiales bacterium]